jgi:hypothetical protein
MIRTLTLVAGAALLVAACGQNQAETAADNTAGPVVATGTAGNEAVDTTPTQDPAAVSAGASSFTEDQARGAFEKAGYTVVGPLTQNANGIWQGTATKGGVEATVGIDYKGAITQP